MGIPLHNPSHINPLKEEIPGTRIIGGKIPQAETNTNFKENSVHGAALLPAIPIPVTAVPNGHILMDRVASATVPNHLLVPMLGWRMGAVPAVKEVPTGLRGIKCI